MRTKRYVFSILLFLIFNVNYFANFSGSGSSSAYPFFQKVLNEYAFQNNSLISYYPNNSYQGYLDLLSLKVHFSAVDMYIDDNLLHRDHKKNLIHLPIYSNAVAVAFQLNDIKSLNLDSNVISKIYTGDILYWDDPLIQELNPTVNLPYLKIIPIFRQSNSGTTYLFSHFLNQSNSFWANNIGITPKLSLSFGLSAIDSKSVAELIKQINGSIGYIGYSYAKNQLATIAIKNKSGKFISPNQYSISEASNIKIPLDTRILNTNTSAAKGYPITSFTWMIFFNDQSDFHDNIYQAQAFQKFLYWMVDQGQQFTDFNGHAPISAQTLNINKKLIKSLTFNGRQL